MEISCAFSPRRDTPDLIALAEELGYERAFVYDSPALSQDVWMTLARAADRTSHVKLGPGVLVPSLRHVMVTAAAIATLVDLAPGRVTVAVGSGFTGRRVLGQSPMRWSDVRQYVKSLQMLLAGGTVEWEAANIEMIHPAGWAPARPITVELLIGADGPKGFEVAREVGDGILSSMPTGADFEWQAVLSFATVLDPEETLSDERVIRAVGPGVATGAHFGYEQGGVLSELVDSLPGGRQWRAAIDAIPPGERHLRLHENHLVGLNDRDLPIVTPELIEMFTLSGWPEMVAEKLAGLRAMGVTEIVYQPAGDDLARELQTFLAAARPAASS